MPWACKSCKGKWCGMQVEPEHASNTTEVKERGPGKLTEVEDGVVVACRGCDALAWFAQTYCAGTQWSQSRSKLWWCPRCNEDVRGSLAVSTTGSGRSKSPAPGGDHAWEQGTLTWASTTWWPPQQTPPITQCWCVGTWRGSGWDNEAWATATWWDSSASAPSWTWASYATSGWWSQ